MDPDPGGPKTCGSGGSGSGFGSGTLVHLLVCELPEYGVEDMVGSPGSGRPHVQLQVHPVQEGAVNGPRQVGGGQHQHVPLLPHRVYTVQLDAYSSTEQSADDHVMRRTYLAG